MEDNAVRGTRDTQGELNMTMETIKAGPGLNESCFMQSGEDLA